MSTSNLSPQEAWAHFRFSVVGPLLSAPPAPGTLRQALKELSARLWRHPTQQDRTVRFSFATIERWYYAAQAATNPVTALYRGVRRDAGKWKVFSERLQETINAQYKQHPHWSGWLHHANLKAMIKADPTLGPLPSYPSLRRFLRAKGLRRLPRRSNVNRPGLAKAQERFARCEVRSFEVDHVGGLWHLDFHTSREVAVLISDGSRKKPHLLGILDDHSRLCCHAQFYLDETTETLAHGFCQALLKRGLPRALLSDNGSEMIAAEFKQGLANLGIIHETTLPYSPYQNGKQENFWGVIEGQFLAMLDHVPDLTLDQLNHYTQAWVEQHYHREYHSEIKTTPLDRFLNGPCVLQPIPTPDHLRDAFRQRIWRKIRHSDTTLTLWGIRFEVPAAFRHYSRVCLAVARWDLGRVDIVDERTGKPLRRIYPIDKSRNSSGHRRAFEITDPQSELAPTSELPTLLSQILAEYAASGLPPAYLPFSEHPDSMEETNES